MATAPPVSPLIVAGVPTNIRLPRGSRATHVDADIHDIAERLREIDPRYVLSLLEHVDGRAVWAVCEELDNGREELVFRVGPGCQIDALDGRVIEHARWIHNVPAAERMKQIEKELAHEAAARKEHEREALYDKIGGSFYNNLHKCGFIDTPKPNSLRPLNATARRAGRKMA